MMIFFYLLSFAAACSDPLPSPDAGTPDADADDAGQDVGDDGDVINDSDIDRPDTLPPACEDPPAPVELSPEPAVARSPRLSVGEEGYAALWLQGASSPYDIMMTSIDTSGAVGAASVVATARPYAADPEAIWFDGAWSVFWREAVDEESCASEDSCQRGLRVARVSSEGAPITEPDTLWENALVTDRPSLQSAQENIWITMTVVEGTDQRVQVGRLARAGVEQELLSVAPEHTARASTPTTALIDGTLVVVAAVAPSGLAGVVLSTISGEITTGPALLIEDASASEPHLAVEGSSLGLAYLATFPEGSRTGIFLTEIGQDLSVPYTSVEVTSGSWPHSPQLVGVNEGWLVTWYDGRDDAARDCVNFGFCRDDVYLSMASISGAVSQPRSLSQDPNDCENPSLFSVPGMVGVAWETYRTDRATTVFTTLSCE